MIVPLFAHSNVVVCEWPVAPSPARGLADVIAGPAGTLVIALLVCLTFWGVEAFRKSRLKRKLVVPIFSISAVLLLVFLQYAIYIFAHIEKYDESLIYRFSLGRIIACTFESRIGKDRNGTWSRPLS